MRSALRPVGVQRAKPAEQKKKKHKKEPWCMVHRGSNQFLVCVICRAAPQLTERLEDGWSYRDESLYTFTETSVILVLCEIRTLFHA